MYVSSVENLLNYPLPRLIQFDQIEQLLPSSGLGYYKSYGITIFNFRILGSIMILEATQILTHVTGMNWSYKI